MSMELNENLHSDTKPQEQLSFKPLSNIADSIYEQLTA